MKQKRLTDRDLIKRVLEDDSNAFKIIISRTKGLVVQITYKLINNQKDREDLTQEIYLKVYSKLSSFKFNSKLSTWVGTVAYNTCINYLEKRKIAIIDIDSSEETWSNLANTDVNHSNSLTDVYIHQKERSLILKLEIEKLPPLYKMIITLFHSEELSYKEISQITNLPEGTLKNYLFRARKKLRENIQLNYKKDDL